MTMPTRLLPLLLLSAFTVILHVAESRLPRVDGGAKPVVFEAVTNCFTQQAGRLECVAGKKPRTTPANDNPTQQPETQYESCLLASDLFVSSSEKFDSSFCESMVLHLVAKTTGKLQLVDLVNKSPRSPSLLRMNVMLQV